MAHHAIPRGYVMPGATPIATAAPRGPACAHARPAPSPCRDRFCPHVGQHLHSICPVSLPGCPSGVYFLARGVWKVWP